MSYSERAYFKGEPCAHVAAYLDALNTRRIESRIYAVACGFRSL